MAIALAAGLHAQASKTRTYVETLASPRLEGRLAGSNGERLASDFIAAEFAEIGAETAAGPDQPADGVRVHRRHEGRWLDNPIRRL